MIRFLKRLGMREWLTLIFTLAIAVGLLGRHLSRGDNRDYRVLQQELKAPDVIDTVLYDPALGQLYVCYDDANQVDVYSENGTFLWAVATPYIRNTDFILLEGNLILYGNGDAYLYRAANGVFVECRDTDDLELPRTQTDQCPEEIEFGAYRVWRVLEDGGKQVLVSRPWWNRIFDFMLNWGIAMACAAGMGILRLLDRAKRWSSVRKNLQFSTKRAKRIYNYYRCAVCVLFTLIVLEYLLAVFGVCPIYILFPVTACFIVSGILLDNPLARTPLSEEEEKTIMFWRACHLGTYVFLFIASIGALMLWDALGQ